MILAPPDSVIQSAYGANCGGSQRMKTPLESLRGLLLVASSSHAVRLCGHGLQTIVAVRQLRCDLVQLRQLRLQSQRVAFHGAVQRQALLHRVQPLPQLVLVGSQAAVLLQSLLVRMQLLPRSGLQSCEAPRHVRCLVGKFGVRDGLPLVHEGFEGVRVTADVLVQRLEGFRDLSSHS